MSGRDCTFDPDATRKTCGSLLEQLTELAEKDLGALKKLHALNDGTEQACSCSQLYFCFREPERIALKTSKHLQMQRTGKDENGLAGADPLLLGGDRSPEHQTKATVSGLYPLLSIFNHSCCPNSCYIFAMTLPFSELLRISRKKSCCWVGGDEVTIAYTYAQQEPLARRREILEACGFTCQRCLLEASLPAFVRQGL
ncbi:hypothetical protein WJX77_004705 [Trebouxia sp. C0004]